MESHIRKLKIDTDAGSLATYAIIMFGMIFMLYLFGFTSLWTAYQATELAGQEGTIPLSDPVLNAGVNLIGLITSSIEVLVVSTATAIGLIAIFIFARGAASTILTFLIPIILLVVLNVFVFPLSGMSDALIFADAPFPTAIITTGLIIFFNLFYILAVLEFIRGPH